MTVDPHNRWPRVAALATAGTGIRGHPTPEVDLTGYRPLFRYLDQRFADNVVLTFGQIESLLGVTLPYLAYVEPQWWSGSSEPASVQSAAWVKAHRTAVPNLQARTVAFERTLGS